MVLNAKKYIAKLFLGIVLFIAFFSTCSIIRHTGTSGIDFAKLYKLNGTACISGILSTKKVSSANNVCNYGMKGDGVFDNSDIFRSLIAKHKTLYFPAGTYLFKSAIEVTSGVSLVGESSASTIFLFDNSTNANNWNFNVNCSGFSASNITFELANTAHYANKSNIGSSLVKVSSTNKCSFDSCNFACGDSTPYYYNTLWVISDSGPISNVTLKNCSVINTANGKVGGALWIYGCTYPISNVKVNNCTFQHTGWDENVGIWSKDSIPLKNIVITNCKINNTNSIMSSDQLMSVLLRTSDSSVKITNNSFQGNGRINTGIKLQGIGKYVFDTNTVSIKNALDNESNYGFLCVLDSDNLQFTNNIIALDQSFRARMRINRVECFEKNKIAINAPSLKIDTDTSSQAIIQPIFLKNNDFMLSIDALDISTILSFIGGSVTFNKHTDIYLPYAYSHAAFDNCTVSGNAKVIFENNLPNTVVMTNPGSNNNITANKSNRLQIY